MSKITTPAVRSLTEEIRGAVRAGEVSPLPPLPELVRRLQAALAEGDKVSLPVVARLIESDPAVATAVLKVANSALFAGLSPIEDLPHAVGRLGLKQVTSLVTTLLHKGHFRSPSRDRQEMLRALWHHSVACALATRRLAEIANADPEMSYLAGLLHDIGKLVVLSVLDQLTVSGTCPEPTASTATELMGVLHAELGHWTLAEWKVPETVAEAARLHHQDPATTEDPVILRVQAANVITSKIGHHLDPDPELNLQDEPAVDRLNLGDVELAALMVDVEDEVAKVLSLF